MVAAAEQQPVEFAKIQAATTDLLHTLNPNRLKLRSTSALVMDPEGNVVYGKQVDQVRPIASITKLMTAMVILDAGLDLQERIVITKADRDLIRYTGSRLKYGAKLRRQQLLQLMLMASENRAASALARTYPGGEPAFVRAMNLKAQQLGMHNSHFAGPSGLHAGNQSSARDIVTMVQAAHEYPLIREATTTAKLRVHPFKGRGDIQFRNTNRLLKNQRWSIQLSKTGYIREAGRCLVMLTEIADQRLVIVLLNAYGKLSPYGDSNRIRNWIENALRS